MENGVFDISKVCGYFVDFTCKLVQVKYFARESSLAHRVLICKLIDVLVENLLDIKEDLSHEKNASESEKK